MKKTHNILLAVSVFLVAFMVYWRFFNKQISHVNYLKTSSLFNKLETENTALDKIVLGYNSGIYFNYDAIVNASAKLKELSDKIPIENNTIKQFSTLKENLKDKLNDVEIFKSHHAVLKNSLHSTIFLANKIRSENTNNPLIKRKINTILESALKFELNINDEKKQLEYLKSTLLIAKKSDSKIHNSLIALDKHLGILLNYKNLITNDIDKILNKNITKNFNTIKSILNSDYQLDRVQRDYWDTLIFILSILTIFGVITLIIILKKKSNELYLFNNQLEEKVKLRTSELIQKNNSLDSFVYRVSHDLKAPMISMMSMVKVINDHLKSDDKIVKEALAFLNDSGKRFQITIADMLELTRVEHETSIEKENVDLNDIVKEVLEENKELVESSKLKITLNFSDLQSVYMARVDVKSIFHNLISNSMKYKHANRDAIVEITTEKINNKFILTFTDNGIGINTELNKSKLFGMFKRFSNQAEGTGVGLYMVKKIVENNNGKIALKSKLNHGTEFKITLPYINKVVT